MDENIKKMIQEILIKYGKEHTRQFLINGEMSEIVSIGTMARLNPRTAGLRLLVFGNIGDNNKKMVIDAINKLFDEMISNGDEKQ